MIGGSQGVPRRSLREPNNSSSSSTSRHASAERAPTSQHQHPHASSRPLPPPPSQGADQHDLSQSSQQLVQELTALSQRQLVFSPAVVNQQHQKENQQQQQSHYHQHSRSSSNADQGGTGSGDGSKRELSLLWKALEEERHVVKMKNEVIRSLETNLKSEKSSRIQLEAECDALRDTVENLRSQIQMSRSLHLADGEMSPPAGSPPRRPNPLPIGFATGARAFQQQQQQKNRKNETAQQKRAALLLSGGNANNQEQGEADDEDMSPGMRAALANEYLETELNNTLEHFERYGRQTLFMLADLEKAGRTMIEDCCQTDFSSMISSFVREQRSILFEQESTSRRQQIQSWCSSTLDTAMNYSQDREQSAVRYFKQSFNRIEKELFVNMQDLARADDRTMRHHQELARHIDNFYDHLQNLHYQCEFELFSGESNIVRWKSALAAASYQLPRWFSVVQEEFNNAQAEKTDLFTNSFKLLLQRDMTNRQRAATSQLMMMKSSSNTSTPIGTPRSGHPFNLNNNTGMNDSYSSYPQQHHHHEDPHYHHHQDENNNNDGNSGELFERIRHLESRLAQKTRLIGLHVKRIQELEIEVDSVRGQSGYAVPPMMEQQQPVNVNNNSNNPAAQQLLQQASIRNSQNNTSINNNSFGQQQQNRSGSSSMYFNNNQNQNYNRGGGYYNNNNNNNNNNTITNHNNLQQLEEQRQQFASLPQNQVIELFEEWRDSFTFLVTEMHEDLMMIIRPWSRVPRAILAQMYDAAQSQRRERNNNNNSEQQHHSGEGGNSSSYIPVNPHLHPDAGSGQSPPKQSKTMYIRGLSRNDVKEHDDYEIQSMAANLINSPDATFDNALNSGQDGLGKNASKTLWNHFFNYVAMTLLEEAREYSINLLREHDDLVSAFHVLKPVIRSVDVVRLSLMEGALSLAEAQRDQALTSSHWIHTQAEQAVETLRGLVTRTEDVTAEIKGQTAEDAANHARAVAAARRLEELGQGGGGGSGGNAASSNGTMQEVMTAFDNVQSQQAALNDPEQAENQRLSEEFANKCNLLVNRASFLYKRLIEREQDVDILSRSLAEVETKETETRDSTDATLVAQVLEREIADDALFMLREAMLEERQYAQETIRTLLNEIQERNFAIRDMQNFSRNLLTSCRYSMGLAEHAKYSMEAMHECYYDMGRKLLATQRAKLLPPISEVALQMFVAHFEYCDSLLQSHVNFLDQAHSAEANVDALVQRRKIYEKEMVTMGQEVFRLNQENRIARNTVKSLEQWAFDFVTDSASYIQGLSAAAFTELRGELLQAYSQVEQLKRMLPSNYKDVNEALEVEKFERTAFEERAKLLEQKLTRATTDVLESQHDLTETRQICEKLDFLRVELETNNRELEMLLLQEREAAEQLRDKNMEITDELTEVRSELANVKRALLTESEAHSATIRNFSRRHS